MCKTPMAIGLLGLVIFVCCRSSHGRGGVAALPSGAPRVGASGPQLHVCGFCGRPGRAFYERRWSKREIRPIPDRPDFALGGAWPEVRV